MRSLPRLVAIRVVDKILKELPLVDVPSPVEPRCPQLRRQILQTSDVVRLLPQQRLVVRDLRLDEGIILRILVRIENAIDKQPLEISMARPAWVQRVVCPLRKPVRAAHTGVDLLDPFLAELRRFVDEDHVILRALILVEVVVLCAVAERDAAAVRETEDLFRLVVLCKSLQLRPQLVDVVVAQLRHRPPHNQDLDSRIAQRQQLSLCAYRPAFPAATCSAVCDVPVLVGHKEPLLRLYRADCQRSHSLLSSSSRSISIFTPCVSRFLPSSASRAYPKP